MDTALSEVLVFKLFRSETATLTVPSPAIVITFDIIKHCYPHYFPADKVFSVETFHFPVQVRFSPFHERFHIVVCSPGEASTTWMVILVSISGRPFRVIRTQPSFSPETVNHILRLAASLDEAGYSTTSIINLLVTEGGAA